MKYLSKIITLFLYVSIFLAGCVSTPSNNKIPPDSNLVINNGDSIPFYSDKVDERDFIHTITTDTTHCTSFWNERKLIAVLSNKLCRVETTGFALYLRTDRIKMWVCNLPEQVNHVGDTIVVSAKVYDTFGDENTWGKPAVLYKVLIRK
jgi:hypothetical protein